MRLGKDIRIHAQGKARLDFPFGGALGQQLQFRLALHVEGENSGLERPVDLVLSLAHPGEDHPFRGLGRGGQHTLQLPSRDDIEAPLREPPAASEWPAPNWP